jgi:farnesyl diphosphate synthase
MKTRMFISPEISVAFEAAKPGIIASLQSVIVKWPVPPLSTHFQELVDWTTAESPPLPGLLAAHVFLALTGSDPSSPSAHPAYALGWIVELFHMSTAILHDLTHEATTRQGKPCWKPQDNRGYAGIADSYFLENAVHILVVKYFSEPDVRRALKQLIQKATVFTGLSQIPISPDRDIDVGAVWLPIVTALCASQKVPKEVWLSDQVKSVLFRAS